MPFCHGSQGCTAELVVLACDAGEQLDEYLALGGAERLEQALLDAYDGFMHVGEQLEARLGEEDVLYAPVERVVTPLEKTR